MKTDADDEILDDKIKKMSLEEKVNDIYKFMARLVYGTEAISKDASFNTQTMCEVFRVTEFTLLRWRRDGRIPYHVKPNGYIYYMYDEIFAAVSSGRLYGKSFNRQNALDKLRSFRVGLIKGKQGYDLDNAYGE